MAVSDLLRQRAGARRSARYWDRSLWFCCVGVAIILGSVAVYSMVVARRGSPVDATIRSCVTAYHSSGRFGRHVTTCEITVAGQQTAIEMARRHPAGERAVLTTFRGGLSDPELDSDYARLLPIALAILGGTWWLGYPPPKKKTGWAR